MVDHPALRLLSLRGKDIVWLVEESHSFLLHTRSGIINIVDSSSLQVIQAKLSLAFVLQMEQQLMLPIKFKNGDTHLPDDVALIICQSLKEKASNPKAFTRSKSEVDWTADEGYKTVASTKSKYKGEFL